ncbi:hypothetical protein [Candidatus Solirubrobacter pratensis]|uniref:hypothetical protein n=1 Tax=Candidatus Solirubrobacter pratensis TaxID=1298857 RepID=UPI0003FFF8EC|nr:hypothetical protein [Candidatus Solirubrobacter pratensis]
MSAWWRGIAPAQATLECGGETHRVRWEEGRLRLPDHADVEGERALAALGGEPCACLDVLEAWERHAADPRVLLLGTRGPGDRFARQDGHPGVPGAPPPVPELFMLLRLGGGLQERLVATVAASRGEPIAEGERARLHAALYGRVVTALRAWLGEPEADVDLRMDGPPGVRRSGERLEATLPFSWLVDVWARGLAVVWGRFCLAASTEDGRRWTLTTLAPDLGAPERVTVEREASR